MLEMLRLRVFGMRIPAASSALPMITQLPAALGSNKQLWRRQCFYSAPINSKIATPSPLLQHSEWTRCQYSTTGTTTEVINGQAKQQDIGLFNRVLNKVGLAPNSKSRIKVTSHILYETVADKINYLQFFRDFSLPNTFNSWFLVTELHVWMLMVRAMAEGSETGEDGRNLRNCIVEAMWGDVNTRAKKLGASNPSRTRQQIQMLSEQFQAALISYDEGIMSDDTVLSSALWRRFFEMNCDNYEHIERLVKYVRKQIVMLDQLSRDELLNKPKIQWYPLDKVKV